VRRLWEEERGTAPPRHPRVEQRSIVSEFVATNKSLTFTVDGAAIPGSVNILIDGHRVWSTTPPSPDSAGRIHLRWPAVLLPYLHGRATFSVEDSRTDATIAQSSVRIGRTSAPITVTNAQGRWLAVNKWQQLSASLEGDDSGMRERLLERSRLLVDQLQALGYVTYISSGTLLGAIRRADLLPNDDDVDLGILLDSSHPADLSLQSYRLEDQLVGLGYVVVRHSNAHLQVSFLYESGEVDHYIDIFSAFYRSDDEFCQPFHLRAAVPRSSITPVGTLELAGVPFPAPAVPEDWLAGCYGPEWRTPDPSFRFVTPSGTVRRFDGWFGKLDTNRPYWEARHTRNPARRRADGDARHLQHLSRLLPAGVPVVDLGCGTAINSAVIARDGHSVIGVDFSHRALALAGQSTVPNLELRYLNLNDRRRVLEFGAELVRSGRPWHFNLGHVLVGLTREGRENVFLLLRLVLTEGAFAFASFDTDFTALQFREGDPRTWHLPVEWVEREAGRQRLAVQVVSTASRKTRYGRRKIAMTVLRHEHDATGQG